jgi:hypothetical protein
MKRLRRRLQELRDRLMLDPFWRLVHHFAERLFSGGGEAGEGELSLGVGAVLALLATPGLFITVLLFDKYSSTLRFLRGGGAFDPYAQSLPDQYFYFSFSMAITGVVTALKWDSIFPGRRDYMNLAPLPIPTRNIFLANIIAIVTIALLFVIDVNAVSSLLFPYLVTMEKGTFYDFLGFLGSHALGVLLCSLFIFLALFAVVGTLMVVLPNQLFRRLSLYLRVAVVIAMLALLCSSGALPRLLSEPSGLRSPVLGWLPPVWFLGLARSLIGRAGPQLAPLGALGIRVMVATAVLSGAVYLLSYYRYFIRIPETLDIAVRSRAPRKLVPDWFWDRLLLRTPFERACYGFALKTLARNERQSLFLGGFLGLGLVLGSLTLASGLTRAGGHAPPVPSAEFLAVPLILAYFVICGLRFVFALPAELSANWAAQVIVDRNRHHAERLARKVILSLVWPWVLLAGLPLYVYFWGWMVALAHVAVVMSLTYCLADWLLRNFRKIPFTCAYSPLKQNATGAVMVYAFGYILFTVTIAEWEHALLLQRPWHLWLMVLAILAAGTVLSRFRRGELDPTDLIFEESPAPAVELLNLTGRLPQE